MNISIIKLSEGQSVSAQIILASGIALPSITEGWRFNFKKHSKKKGFQTYILVCKDTPHIIEGCLTFQLRDTVEPYMAYVEIAPHNKGLAKKHDSVAGCLISFACRLSFIYGIGHFKGWLAFDVKEERKQDGIKLMMVYCKKYGALKWGNTTMIISPENGEKLIAKYLN